MSTTTTVGATPHNMSETSKHRDKLLQYIPPCDVLDIGYGGDPVVSWAVCCDMAGGSYTNVGSSPQQLGFDCRSLPFKDGTLAACFRSHVIEDFTYREQVQILSEWKRCLRTGGVIVLLQPDQFRFETHCANTGQSLNDNHKERDYSLGTFRANVWPSIAGDMVWVAGADLEDYSWYAVVKKL